MGLSEKQEAFRDYLLKRLGFVHNDFLEKYQERLELIAHIHKTSRAISEEDYDHNKYPFYYFDGNKYVPENYNIIDFLIDEYKIKKLQNYEKLNNKQNYISATDLANFTFCPIGFSIGNTYKTTTNILAEKGTKLHEEAKLVSRIKFSDHLSEEEKKTNSRNISDYINEENKQFFDEISRSKLIYSGHTENENQYFTNEELKFVGQPDYVFQNEKGENFIVEEKFKKAKNSDFNTFYRNHKIQLASYIYFLKNFNAQYGYLVYWFYEYKKKYTNSNYYEYILEYRCTITKINKNGTIENFLKEVYEKVIEFKNKKFFNIDINSLEPLKCASCVFCMYCGHKTGKFKQVTLPYQSSFHRLQNAQYPEILKKEEGFNKNTNEI